MPLYHDKQCHQFQTWFEKITVNRNKNYKSKLQLGISLKIIFWAFQKCLKILGSITIYHIFSLSEGINPRIPKSCNVTFSFLRYLTHFHTKIPHTHFNPLSPTQFAKPGFLRNFAYCPKFKGNSNWAVPAQAGPFWAVEAECCLPSKSFRR